MSLTYIFGCSPDDKKRSFSPTKETLPISVKAISALYLSQTRTVAQRSNKTQLVSCDLLSRIHSYISDGGIGRASLVVGLVDSQ